MSKTILLRGVLAGAVMLGVMVRPASADILFFTSPGSVQPDENLLFNVSGLLSSGTTVQGLTNQTSTILDITGQESLLADGGQANVTAQDGAFTWLFLEPHVADTFFREFEANLTVFKTSGPTPTGSVTVAVTDSLGHLSSNSYVVGAGQNFFSLLAVDPQLIRSVLITSTVGLADIEQIRLGGVESSSPATVPEPATLALFGFGLLVSGRRARRLMTRRG